MMVQLSPDRSGRSSSARHIYEALKAQIDEGVYGAGARLPSTRALASELGASRTTVTAAYEQLVAEGFIETRQGRRAQVATTLVSPPRSRGENRRRANVARLSAYGREAMTFPAPPVELGRLQVDFRSGDISPSDFPMRGWRRALTAAFKHRPRSFRYGDPCGSLELRSALQTYLWRARGLRCEIDRIIVVNGSQQGLDLCARLLLNPGDRFAIENPCYLAARQAFEAAGAAAVLVPVDHEGMQAARLGRSKDARLCYVTPSHQYPLGSILSAPRRQQLLAWAQRTGAYVIEDDYDAEYRYDVRPIRPLQALDHDANVIYLGTFSKTLSPLLRLGYLVVPSALVDAFSAAKRLADRHSPTAAQLALAELIRSGAYERHVRKARRRNAERRAALLDALAKSFGAAVTVEGSNAGLHVVVWFNHIAGEKEHMIAERVRRAGVGIHPISSLYADAGGRGRRRTGLVMGYAALDERSIRRGVALLRGVLGTRAELS